MKKLKVKFKLKETLSLRTLKLLFSIMTLKLMRIISKCLITRIWVFLPQSSSITSRNKNLFWIIVCCLILEMKKYSKILTLSKTWNILWRVLILIQTFSFKIIQMKAFLKIVWFWIQTKKNWLMSLEMISIFLHGICLKTVMKK